MSDETKNATEQAEGDGTPRLDEETLRRISAEYRSGLEELYESRHRRAAELAAMTEEEWEAAMEAELAEMLEDAKKHPVNTARISADRPASDPSDSEG